MVKALLQNIYYSLHPHYIFVGMEYHSYYTWTWYQNKKTLAWKVVEKPV